MSREENYEINIMSTLLIRNLIDDLGKQPTSEDWNKFKDKCKKLSDHNVHAITVDVWWGKIDSSENGKIKLSYYDKVFEIIKNEGLKIIPIISFHKSRHKYQRQDIIVL